MSDASSLAALSIEVWLGTYLNHGINGFFADYVLQEFTTARMETLIADPKQVIHVHENTNGIDGFIRVTSENPAPVNNPSETEISTLYVQPRHHGKGIGKHLLTAALDHCKTSGISSVWLATNAENSPAIAFYLARGFVHVGETYFVIDDQQYLNNVYAHQLG